MMVDTNTMEDMNMIVDMNEMVRTNTMAGKVCYLKSNLAHNHYKPCLQPLQSMPPSITDLAHPTS